MTPARRSSGKGEPKKAKGLLTPGTLVRSADRLTGGPGLVITQTAPDAAEVFFPSAGRQVFAPASAQLWIVRGKVEIPPLLAVAQACSAAMWRRAHHHVYVVELAPTVLQIPVFRAANPDALADRACLYVGMTGLTPQQRLANHWNGVKAARLPRRFGVRLVPELSQHFNPMPFRLAQAMERELAHRLRQRGHAVWQH